MNAGTLNSTAYAMVDNLKCMGTKYQLDRAPRSGDIADFRNVQHIRLFYLSPRWYIFDSRFRYFLYYHSRRISFVIVTVYRKTKTER